MTTVWRSRRPGSGARTRDDEGPPEAGPRLSSAARAGVLATLLLAGTPTAATAAGDVVATEAPSVAESDDDIDRGSALLGTVVGVGTGVGLAGWVVGLMALRGQRETASRQKEHLARVEDLLRQQEQLLDELRRSR
jgi:hypothetical protein